MRAIYDCVQHSFLQPGSDQGGQAVPRPRFLNDLHAGNSFHASCDFSDDSSAECPHPFLSSDWFRSDGIGFDFLPLSKENTKRLGWSDFQPSLMFCLANLQLRIFKFITSLIWLRTLFPTYQLKSADRLGVLEI